MVQVSELHSWLLWIHFVCVLLAPWGISFLWNVSLFSRLVAGGNTERRFDETCDVLCSVKIFSIRQTSRHSERLHKRFYWILSAFLLFDTWSFYTTGSTGFYSKYLSLFWKTTGSTGLYQGSLPGIGFTGLYQLSVVIQELFLLVSSVFLSFHKDKLFNWFQYCSYCTGSAGSIVCLLWYRTLVWMLCVLFLLWWRSSFYAYLLSRVFVTEN